MKTLKDILEGVLDAESNLTANIDKEMNPVPKVRDFERNVWGGIQVDWVCPGIIQRYIDILDSAVIGAAAKEHAVGFRVSIRDKYELTAYIIDDVGSYSAAIDLTGIGADGASIPTQKKETIEFFKLVASKPDTLKTLFEYVNKRQDELNRNGVCDCWTFKQVLKY